MTHLLQASQSDAYSAGYKSGYMVGSAVPVLLTLIGAVWCGAILARPGVNRKGVAALGTLFAGWTLALVLALLQRAAPGQLILSFLMAGVVILSLLVSIALGIAALVDDGRYVQGRGQAIAALVLSVLTGLGVLLGVVAGFMKAATNSREARAGVEAKGEAIVLDLERFRLKSVPRAWVQTSAKKVNDLASLALVRTRPDTWFMVIAEKLPPGTEIGIEPYVAAAKSNLLGRNDTGKIQSETRESINGKEGVRMICTAEVRGMEFVYRYWLHVGPGMAYQVISWTKGKEPSTLLVQTEPLFSNIEILPPKE
jgi:hypothetical protein